MTFNGDVELSDGWNGEYTLSGCVLHIACRDDNGSIAPGGNIGDIGFIVSGGQDLSIME